MAGGGGDGKVWVGILVGGGILCGVAHVLEHFHAGPGWLTAALLAVGGLGVVFGSCEAMILCVDGLARRQHMNSYVAGTLAGLASNLPEIVMLGFVIAKDPRVAFVVVALTLHVSALAFGIYCCVLPRDKLGAAKLPEPMVKLSTDLFACAGGVFLALGCLMMLLNVFETGEHHGEGLSANDLYVVGGVLLFVEVMAVIRLVTRFAGEKGSEELREDDVAAGEEGATVPSIKSIVLFGALGVSTSLLGGHAVGEFAGALVDGLTAHGYSEMIGAIILSLFACAGCYVLIATAHVRGRTDLALANVTSAVTQVPFVVMPISLILMAVFAQMGIVPYLEYGSILAIDLETTSVVILGFPTMLMMWKSVQDDGTVNWVETASMIGLFGLIIYFLAAHG